MDPSTDSSPLVLYVRRLVKKRPADISIKELAGQVGVTPTWLSGFVHERFNNPSVLTIERLHFALTGKHIIND